MTLTGNGKTKNINAIQDGNEYLFEYENKSVGGKTYHNLYSIKPVESSPELIEDNNDESTITSEQLNEWERRLNNLVDRMEKCVNKMIGGL